METKANHKQFSFLNCQLWKKKQAKWDKAVFWWLQNRIYRQITESWLYRLFMEEHDLWSETVLRSVSDVQKTRRPLGEDCIFKQMTYNMKMSWLCRISLGLLGKWAWYFNSQHISWFKAWKCNAACLLKCTRLSLKFVEVWSRMESVRMRRVWVVDAGLKPSGSYARWTPHRPSTSELWWSVTLLK